MTITYVGNGQYVNTVTSTSNFLFNEPTYDYLVFVDVDDSNIVKAKNTRTGRIDYTDPSYIDPVINNIITAAGTNGSAIRLSPQQVFTANNVITLPAQASGSPPFIIHGLLGARSGHSTVIQAANNSTNLNNHSFIESLGGTNGTNNGPSCDIGGISFFNPFSSTQSMGGIALESDIFHSTYSGMNIHDTSLYYASASKGGIWAKGKGFLRMNNIFSSDASAAYVGTIDFCVVGGGTDAAGGNLANDHGDGLIHAQITNLHTSHSGTGVQGAGGSMQHTLWLGAKYAKLSHLGFDGWGFRDDPIVIKDCYSCIINDIHHQDLNVADTSNVGDCSILLYSSDQSSACSCWGNRLYNMRMSGWNTTNRVHIKCDGANSVGPQHNYIELEEYGNSRVRINELHGSHNVFALKPGSHTDASFAQTTALLDNLQSTSNVMDFRGAAQNGGQTTITGSTGVTAYSFNHNLYAAPTWVQVTPANSAAVTAGTYYVTASSTQITVTFTTAPGNGTSNLFWWRAMVYP